MAANLTTERPAAPEVRFRHLRRLTDDTGLLEHAIGRIPRRSEGYTTDDNARALWACVEWIDLDPALAEAERLPELAERYAGFLYWARKADGRFHNNFDYGRRPETEQPSDDCLGRTIWALARTVSSPFGGRLSPAVPDLLTNAFPAARSMGSPRGWAYALAACALLERRRAASGLRDDTDVPLPGEWVGSLAAELARRLLDRYRAESGPGWLWFEPVMTYSNGLMPWALFEAHAAFGGGEALAIARDTFRFLAERMTAPKGAIRPIGNRGWGTRQGTARWDQQPIEAFKLALAAEAGYRATGEREYRDTALACRAWFHGRNDCGAPLADPADGSCCDGLTPGGPNANRGAESTIAWLLTEAVVRRMDGMMDDRPRGVAQSRYSR
jgi:Highly conserved protein containing a thioredoxin domain